MWRRRNRRRIKTQSHFITSAKDDVFFVAATEKRKYIAVTSVIAALLGVGPCGTDLVIDIAQIRRDAANNVFGIFVRPGGVGSGNVAISNSATGISLNNATGTGNTAYNNGTYGIDAVCPGVLVANTAYGNVAGNVRSNGACTVANNTF